MLTLFAANDAGWSGLERLLFGAAMLGVAALLAAMSRKTSSN